MTKEASARGDLKTLQIPHLTERKTHCWAELRVLLQSTQVPCNEQKAGDAREVQHLLNLLPGLARDLGESLHSLCLHLPLAMKSVLIHRIYSQVEIFCACTSVTSGSIYRFEVTPCRLPFSQANRRSGSCTPFTETVGFSPVFPRSALCQPQRLCSLAPRPRLSHSCSLSPRRHRSWAWLITRCVAQGQR